MTSPVAPLELSRALIRCPSVTPVDEGALGVLEEPLGELGFDCKRVAFGEVDNLYARIGKDAPNFCFAGHTDVVPPGDAEAWTHGPFAAEVVGDRLYGRGAADMKCAIASFVAAAGRKGGCSSLQPLRRRTKRGCFVCGALRVPMKPS